MKWHPNRGQHHRQNIWLTRPGLVLNALKKITDPDSKLLECQRCKDHYCTKCLGKTKTEYEIFSKSDTMWFCITCRGKIEEHIVLDLKIEDRCNQIMKEYGDRITQLETSDR